MRILRQDAALLPVYATPLRRVWHSSLLACLCSPDPGCASPFSFSLIYMLLYAFLRAHTKKIEQALDTGGATAVFSANTGMDRGLNCFVGILGADIAIILCSGFVTALQDYTKVIVAVMFCRRGSVQPGCAWWRLPLDIVFSTYSIPSILLCKLHWDWQTLATGNGSAGAVSSSC